MIGHLTRQVEEFPNTTFHVVVRDLGTLPLKIVAVDDIGIVGIATDDSPPEFVPWASIVRIKAGTVGA